jgi:hypothetical protein
MVILIDSFIFTLLLFVGALVMPVTANIATIFQDSAQRFPKKLQDARIENNQVKLASKGSCHFQVTFCLFK